LNVSTGSYPLMKSDLGSLDFVITRVLMKLFKSANVSLINDSRVLFKFLLPSEILEKENKNFFVTLCAMPTYYVILA